MEINPPEKFSFKRNLDNLYLIFDEKNPKGYSFAHQGILVVLNNKSFY